jgi:hypothetical protein
MRDMKFKAKDNKCLEQLRVENCEVFRCCRNNVGAESDLWVKDKMRRLDPGSMPKTINSCPSRNHGIPHHLKIRVKSLCKYYS